MSRPLLHELNDASLLSRRYAALRATTLALAAPLSEADCQVQSMPDASPTKWHLAHVTWFFETFVLERFEPGFRAFRPEYRVLFNSYYNGIGEQHARAQRGLISRPSLAEVRAYRAAVDDRVASLLAANPQPELLALVELGLQHEQQHQELLLTDILHMLSCNPMAPAYLPRWPLARVAPVVSGWLDFPGGLVELGHDGKGFAFDNEQPRHAHFLRPFAIGNRLITHGEWADFVADGGYREPRWWLSVGWDWVRTRCIDAPLYWRRSADDGADWYSFTLHGLVPIDAHTPITHISYFEADAFARWAGASQAVASGSRLPTEAEWEHAAAHNLDASLAAGHFAEAGVYHPMPVSVASNGAMQLFGDVWEWTSSTYQAYPGFTPWAGAVGEYNGKFMANQYVLRGGSCVTPRSHIRLSYRNFFPTDTRWQFNGLRLARDIH